MPYVTGELVDQVLHRVRDPDAIGTSRVFVRRLLTHVQRIVNCRLGNVVEDATFATIPNQQIYQTSLVTSAPNAMRLFGIREGNRDLKRVEWREFFYLERKWSRAVGSRFDLWGTIGRDLFIIWPAQPVAAMVTLVYAKLTDDLVDDTVAIELSDDMVPLLIDLTEALVSLKKRVYPPIAKLGETLQKRLIAF